VGLWRET
jgi:hypothetical protein